MGVGNEITWILGNLGEGKLSLRISKQTRKKEGKYRKEKIDERKRKEERTNNRGEEGRRFNKRMSGMGRGREGGRRACTPGWKERGG